MYFNCKTLQAVLIPFILPFCDVDNYIIKEPFNFNCQPQEEAGSAEEQPASNKADAYTISKGVE